MINNRIQFWRIIMTYVIAIYHFNKRYDVFTSGYIAVEFFFMISGYLLVSKYYAMKRTNELGRMPALKYFCGRYIHFLPYSAVAFFTAFVAVGIYRGYKLADYGYGLFTHLPELFLVNMLGFQTGGGVSFNDITWYLSVLLILSFVIWYLLKLNDRVYKMIILPLSVAVIYVYLFVEYGMLGVHEQFALPFLATGILRGLADMNMGIAAYTLAGICNHKHAKYMGVISTVCLFVGGVILPQFYYHSKWDFLMSAMIFVGVAFAFGCDDNSIFDRKVIIRWSEITLVIYLNHEVITIFVTSVLRERSIFTFVIWFLLITIYSAIEFYVMKCIYRKIHKQGGLRNEEGKKLEGKMGSI